MPPSSLPPEEGEASTEWSAQQREAGCQCSSPPLQGGVRGGHCSRDAPNIELKEDPALDLTGGDRRPALAFLLPPFLQKRRRIRRGQRLAEDIALHELDAHVLQHLHLGLFLD